ncbi:MAG: thiamine-phosphate kinase [Nitrospirae bacterium]|nr:thiamine-phosphate kinase [Nitrospirota bacterium]MBF0540550.1 thiamine-phosphate kinase [Nitrospirota bacterium]
MQLSELGENGIIEYIKTRSFKPISDNSDIIIGIGDDAAALNINSKRGGGKGGNKLLVTTDLMTEGIHFDLSYTTYYQLGFKLISVNVSDIYAMAGSPAYALLALSFPAATKERDLNEFIKGILDALHLYNVALIGGDTCSSKRDVTISATLLGYAAKPIYRDNAKVGDNIYVTGYTGDSACGMELLKRINNTVEIEKGVELNVPLDWNIMSPLINRHLMPKVKMPDIKNIKVNSMMDISDGLATDLKKLCTASGIGAYVYQDRLPISSELKIASEYLNIDPITLCLNGGEDYEYLFTSSDSIDSAFCIGKIISNGFTLINKDNIEKELRDFGYEHFK